MTKARDLADLISSGNIDATEFEYLDGVTSDIQTQLDAKAATSDIGTTIQAYDADTAKLDVAQTWTASQSFGDNYSVMWGNSDDLQIFHNGTNSIIRDAGTGDLSLQSSGTEINFWDTASSQYMLQAVVGGGVSLRTNGDIKFATTTSGIDVTGTVTCDDLINVESSTGHGRLELGGASGGYIDLKSPFSEDFNARIAYFDSNGALEIRTYNNEPIKLQHQSSTKLETTSTGVDVTGEITADSYNETYTALSGTTPTVDCEAGNVFALSTTGNTTFTFSNPPASGTAYGFTLKLTAGGTHTITYPASVDWAAATAPDAPASGETDVYVFFTHDGGTTWYGARAIDAAG